MTQQGKRDGRKPRVQAARRIMAIIGKVRELDEIVGPGELRNHLADAQHKLKDALRVAGAAECERIERARARAAISGSRT